MNARGSMLPTTLLYGRDELKSSRLAVGDKPTCGAASATALCSTGTGVQTAWKAENSSSETQQHHNNSPVFLSLCLLLRLAEAALTNRNIFMECEVRLALQGGEILNIQEIEKFGAAKL